ncbi:MAG: NYN domain-containing protein [Deltaproteobacteria bacterium]|jgi:hypothetical protein|nr:NYN domain-containing protein [Deltaproteobacteria bacterium]
MSRPIKTTAALIIDIENLIGGFNKENGLEGEAVDTIRQQIIQNFDIGPVCKAVQDLYGSLFFRISIGDIFFSCKRTGNLDLINQIKRNFHLNLIDIHDVCNFQNVKNHSDFVVYTETLDLAYREESIDSFAIVSMDKGFIPMYIKLKQLGKSVTVVGMSKSMTPEYPKGIVDHVLYIDELIESFIRIPYDMPDNRATNANANSLHLTVVGTDKPTSSSIISTSQDDFGNDGISDEPDCGDVGPYFIECGSQGESDEPKPDKRFVIPPGELPSWVTLENYLTADKMVKAVENILRVPVLSRDQNACICHMLESIFKEATSTGGSIKMLQLSDKITQKILEGEEAITPLDFQEYTQPNKSLEGLIDSVVYKVVRTLYMNDVFTKLPYDNKNARDATFTSFREARPDLLARLYAAYFGIIRYQDEERFALVPETLVMAFYAYPTEDARNEMNRFVEKYYTYRKFYKEQANRARAANTLN